MHDTSRGRHNAHALRPQIGEIGEDPLSELARSLCGPDDVPLEIDDLAQHFLLEATQATPSSSPPEPEAPSLAPTELEASLGAACFEDQDGRSGQRDFERLWHEIIDRELAATAAPRAPRQAPRAPLQRGRTSAARPGSCPAGR